MPEGFEAEAGSAWRAMEIGKEEGAVVKVGGGQGLHCTSMEEGFPCRIAEEAIEPNKGRLLSFVAPGESSIEAAYLLQFSEVEGRTELAHQASVEDGVVFIPGFVDKVEITRY
jgi:hypothetical protein